MNINELDEQANAHAGLISWQCNIPADQILELIAAYREAVALLKHIDIDNMWSDEKPYLASAFATAKRLGVE